MTSYVYLIAHIESDCLTGPVKVGMSDNPKSRLATIQTSNPKKLALACIFAMPDRPTAVLVEGAFHTVMDNYRMSGEWFDMCAAKASYYMCSNIYSFLSVHYGFDGDELEEILHISGVTAEMSRLEGVLCND